MSFFVTLILPAFLMVFTTVRVFVLTFEATAGAWLLFFVFFTTLAMMYSLWII